jgi:hypothetical protein
MNTENFEPPPSFWIKSPQEWYELQKKVQLERTESGAILVTPLGSKMPPEQRNDEKLGYLNPGTQKRGTPDYARFIAKIRYAGGSRGGYSRFPSWEMVNFNGNEKQGLEDLIYRVIMSIPVDELIEAMIFANLTLNLRTDSRAYDYPIACYKPVNNRRYGKRIENIWYKKTVAFAEIAGKIKVDINETLTLQRLAHNTIYVAKKSIAT